MGLDLWLFVLVYGVVCIVILLMEDDVLQYCVMLVEQVVVVQVMLQGFGELVDEVGVVLIDVVDVVVFDVCLGSVDVLVLLCGFCCDMLVVIFVVVVVKCEMLDFVFDYFVCYVKVFEVVFLLLVGVLFGVIIVNCECCMLCMVCVGVCLLQVLCDQVECFVLVMIECNCVQCGLCEIMCFESVIVFVLCLNLLVEVC